MSFIEIPHTDGLTTPKESKQLEAMGLNETDVIEKLEKEKAPVKSNRGRKRKYTTDEERILARRVQQKAYRERKKNELFELRALKTQLDSETKNISK